MRAQGFGGGSKGGSNDELTNGTNLYLQPVGPSNGMALYVAPNYRAPPNNRASAGVLATRGALGHRAP